MAVSSYHFITRWQLDAPCEEIYCILEKADDLARWWPSVYLDVKTRKKGLPGGVGKVVELFTKGWLPYSLRWKFRVTATRFPDGFSLEAMGDFVGTGTWTFSPTAENGCLAVYDWRISAEKPLLKYLSFLMKPLFSANHEWAMKMGHKSLQLEIRRQRGETNVPAPPPPVFPHNLLNNRIL